MFANCLMNGQFEFLSQCFKMCVVAGVKAKLSEVLS